MSKTPFLEMFVAFLLALCARPVEAQIPYQNGCAYMTLLRVAYKGLERAAAVFAPSKIPLLADGGGDGGGGDGGGGDGSGGDGSGSGDGSGDGTSSADGGDGNGDASNATDDPGVAAVAAPSEPDAISVPTDVPTNDPTMSLRGGVPSNGSSSPSFVAQTGTTTGPTGPSGAQDVAIHAVIISGVLSPWDAISKAPGVRNVTLTGGLVALGKTPRPGETVAGGSPPSFLKIIPDPKLLNGSIIPPVVPNVIDVRIVGYSVTADMPSD